MPPTELASVGVPDWLLPRGETVRDVVMTEEQPPISAKGFAKPISTFKVVGTYDELVGAGRIVLQERKGLRVLVADNDERVRRSAHALLGRFGCVVETARDGKEALTMARLCTYDAILTDIRLPDVTGYEVYSRLRQAQPRARVIMMTAFGYDPHHSIVKARQEGLRFVLYKPFRVDQLLEALESPDPAAVTPDAKPQAVQA